MEATRFPAGRGSSSISGPWVRLALRAYTRSVLDAVGLIDRIEQEEIPVVQAAARDWLASEPGEAMAFMAGLPDHAPPRIARAVRMDLAQELKSRLRDAATDRPSPLPAPELKAPDALTATVRSSTARALELVKGAAHA